ncbi:MAG TPA: extracellular solute-binding protein [Patescibacteria group bacterium]|nr:extracellular solute-binding protein [Patescibacteria group bacterium]
MLSRPLARPLAVIVASALLVAACAPATPTPSPAPPTPTPGPAAATPSPEPAATPAVAGMVTIYTGRHYGIEPVFDEFTAATGIEVRFTTGSDPELRERLVAEGGNTPADVLMTADAGNIALAAEAGVLAPIDSDVLEGAVPAELRDPQNRWFALSQRARVVIYSTERVTAPPTTYAEVGDPQWRGRVCLRPATHPYTQSLVSSMILADGEEAAERIVASWVANDPLYINSDTDIFKAVAAGDCDIAIANTYYLGRLIVPDPAFPVAISWPEQGAGGRGAHVNISAAAVTAHAPNPEAARTLLEWLASDGQRSFVDVNFEYPVNPDVAIHPVVAAWGEFRADRSAVVELGRLQPTAVKLLDRVGYE